MVTILNSQDSDFASELKDALNIVRDTGHDVSAVVKDIIKDIRQNGDQAVLQYTQKFDDKNAELEKLIVSDEELLEAKKKFK